MRNGNKPLLHQCLLHILPSHLNRNHKIFVVIAEPFRSHIIIYDDTMSAATDSIQYETQNIIINKKKKLTHTHAQSPCGCVAILMYFFSYYKIIHKILYLMTIFHFAAQAESLFTFHILKCVPFL